MLPITSLWTLSYQPWGADIQKLLDQRARAFILRMAPQGKEYSEFKVIGFDDNGKLSLLNQY
jgi:hypothetical protein